MYLKSEFRTGFRTFWEDELVRPSSFGGRDYWSVIKRTSGWKKGSLFLWGSADQCLVPYGIVRALPHTVAIAHWVWWGKAAWDALWEFWLRPGQSTVGPSVFKCQRSHLGGQLVGQELGIRLKELRWVFLSLSLGSVPQNNPLSRNTVKRHHLWERLWTPDVLRPCAPASPLPQFCGPSSRNRCRLWSIWTCLLPHISSNRDHKFQRGARSLENERVKEALKAELPPSLHGRESTRDHKTSGKDPKIQQFLRAWVPTSNLIPTPVEVIYVSLFLTAHWPSSQMYTRDMKGEIRPETKQASERLDTSQAVPMHRGYLRSKWLCLMPSTSSAWMKW